MSYGFNDDKQKVDMYAKSEVYTKGEIDGKTAQVDVISDVFNGATTARKMLEVPYPSGFNIFNTAVIGFKHTQSGTKQSLINCFDSNRQYVGPHVCTTYPVKTKDNLDFNTPQIVLHDDFITVGVYNKSTENLAHAVRVYLMRVS